jgi:hypothetical protein
MPRRKIVNWTTIRNMCRRRFAAQAAEEVEVQAVELARQHAEQEVAAFEREGEVAQEAMDRVMEEAAAVAADVAVGKMHAAAARKAEEAVAMEAAMAALRAMRNDTSMVSREVVAKEVAMRELRDGVVSREAEAEAQMYIDDAVAEESRVATAAVVASGTSAWLLIDDDEMEVEDDDEDEEAEVEAERDAELRAANAAIREAAAKRDTEMETRAWQDHAMQRTSPRRGSRWRQPWHRRRRSASPRRRLRSARRRSSPPTGRPRWTRPSPTVGTSIGGRLAAAPRLSTALSGAELCAARTPRWQRSMPPAPPTTATELPCCRETAGMATKRQWRPRSHDFPRRDGGAGSGGGL